MKDIVLRLIQFAEDNGVGCALFCIVVLPIVVISILEVIKALK